MSDAGDEVDVSKSAVHNANNTANHCDEDNATDCPPRSQPGAGRARPAGLSAAFSAIPETPIARTHAARPAHIRANPLASARFQGPHQFQGPPPGTFKPPPPASGSTVISPRFEIPLTPPDAPPTPPEGAGLPAVTKAKAQPKPGRVSGPLWRLGAAARQ